MLILQKSLTILQKMGCIWLQILPQLQKQNVCQIYNNIFKLFITFEHAKTLAQIIKCYSIHFLPTYKLLAVTRRDLEGLKSHFCTKVDSIVSKTGIAKTF